jgi:hypothetical protein
MMSRGLRRNTLNGQITKGGGVSIGTARLSGHGAMF